MCIRDSYHGAQHKDRFWQIVLGFWFKRFVNVIINRFNTLDHCLNKYQISGTTILGNNTYSLATADSDKAVWSFEDDRWNNALNSRLLELLNFEKLLIDKVTGSDEEGYYGKPLYQKNPAIRSLLIKTWKNSTRLSGKFVRDNDAFIIS